MPHCTAIRARRRRDPLPANNFSDIASQALNRRTCIRSNSPCVQRLSRRVASGGSTRSINDVWLGKTLHLLSAGGSEGGSWVAFRDPQRDRSLGARQHHSRQRAAEWKQGCIWALRPIKMDSATQDWHEEAPFDVCRIAHTGTWRTSVAEVFVQRHAQANTFRRRVDAGGASEDKMAEIVMAHGPGQLRASGPTTAGYVSQGQR